jgi:hypothetical protein
MSTSKLFLSLVLLLAVTPTPAKQRSQQSDPTASAKESGKEKASGATEFDKVVDKIIKREQDEMTAFSLYKPVIETYIQELKPDKDMGYAPDRDEYFIGQADLAKGVAVRSMLPKGVLQGMFSPWAEGRWNPGGFLEMIYVDRNEFDRKHYDFHYAGRDFLGEVRCLMIDVTPSHKSGKGRFEGRIWVEDHDFTIVRFNGVYTHQQNMAHFDSWRMNVQPDMWLPAYVYLEELNHNAGALPRFKAQTHFWAFSPTAASHEDEFSDLVVEGDASQIQDDSLNQGDRSPLEQTRDFDREAEDNVLDTLVRAGLLAPEGDVDKVLNTVLNNLVVTNHLEIAPEPRCRVLLTSNIELFSVGHTIVVSRGLLDVLPDEPTLAVMLAQALADAMASKGTVEAYGFSDVRQISTDKAMKTFSFKDSQQDWQATGAKALELLGNSPYRMKLGSAALFLKELNQESKVLPHLIGPHLGNQIYPIASLTNSGPDLQPGEKDQIAALPMGSRIKLDPWDDTIRMLKATPVAILSAREKMPFEVTPFMPYLARYHDTKATQSSTNGPPVSQEQPPGPSKN